MSGRGAAHALLPVRRPHLPPAGGPQHAHQLGGEEHLLRRARLAASCLQGYDDFAGVVDVPQPDGTVTRELQRDYSELVPLLRHRWQPEHPAVKRILDRDRTLRMTIDARLQLRAADVLAKYAQQAGFGGAAVVLDPATGDLLAAVSYPWPQQLAGPGRRRRTMRARPS